MLTNTSIKFRLIFVMSILSALLLAIGTMGLYGFSQSNAGMKTLYEDRLGPAVQLGTILDGWYRVQANVVAAINLSNPDTAKTLSAEAQQLVQKNEGLWAQFQAVELIPEEVRLSRIETEQHAQYVAIDKLRFPARSIG